MKSFQILILVVAAMLISMANADTQTQYKEPQFFKTHNSTKNPSTPSSENENYSASLRGAKGFHGRGGVMTCDKYPRVCRVKGSEGPDCCNKRCVNVSTDRNNCGMCGKRCRYSQICCRGKCVNPMFDKHHCGYCDNKCKKGNSCVYGMCSYA